MRFITASRIRRFGFFMCLWALAFASFLDGWKASFLVGMLILGIGVGLWGWEGGDL